MDQSDAGSGRRIELFSGIKWLVKGLTDRKRPYFRVAVQVYWVGPHTHRLTAGGPQKWTSPLGRVHRAGLAALQAYGWQQ
eukprot:7444314-Pyramimonas_sp.AAC.1